MYKSEGSIKRIPHRSCLVERDSRIVDSSIDVFKGSALTFTILVHKHLQKLRAVFDKVLMTSIRALTTNGSSDKTPSNLAILQTCSHIC